MPIRQIVERFFAVARYEGMSVAMARIVAATRRALRSTNGDAFDVALNIETLTEVPLWRLRIPSVNAKFGVGYQTTASPIVLGVLNRVPADRRNFTFIDLGCGKGRTLILAAQHGFKKVVGVEFSPELAAIARRNIGQVGVSAEVLEMDVCQFNPPADNLVIYMFNPFGGPVMQSVIRNLLEWRRQNSNMAFVAYVNATCESFFDSIPAFEHVGDTTDARIWKLC